jgi:P pilus assembly protein, porin PapC
VKAKFICALLIFYAVRQTAATESDLHFNPAFLNGESGNNADLSWVNAGSALPPGEYNIHVYIIVSMLSPAM